MTTKKTRIKHAPEFKAEALELAEKVGVAAARQLSLYESKIYGWRKVVKKVTKVSDRERELATENAKLKRLLAEQAEELDIVKKAATYFVYGIHEFYKIKCAMDKMRSYIRFLIEGATF